MNITQAIQARTSTRAFTDEPVDPQAIVRALQVAARAPSGGNLQPWRICLLTGERLAEFRALMETRLAGTPHPDGDAAEYRVYPPGLKEPYRTSRFRVGEQMYALLGIEREDKAKRLEWFANNYRFFGAPAAIFCFVDRVMGPPQWSDLGMFLQTFMLLMVEQGLATCAQEAWAAYPRTVGEFCKVPDEWMLFCGMAIGHADPEHPVNRLLTEREPPEVWLNVL